MNLSNIIEIFYIIVLVLVCLRIIYDTETNNKTIAYLIVAIFIPFAGMIFYFFFGINYRKRKMYSKKLIANEKLSDSLKSSIYQHNKLVFSEQDASIGSDSDYHLQLIEDTISPLTHGNAVKVLVNGEQKFPEVLEALQQAKHHIHMLYYIYENDEIGHTIENLLIQKAKEGVTVRFIYDDFGSRTIRGKMVRHLKENGVQAVPFFKTNFPLFSNKINYRNHRKIIVIDGTTAFTGGINVSDRYINGADKAKLFWRDTHLRIDGPGALFLQYLFLCDWNFCANMHLKPTEEYFPKKLTPKRQEDKIVQIVGSGPDSDLPSILFSIIKCINSAKKEILISNPYFIPNESLFNALEIAALSGVSIKLLLPQKSDSSFVNYAARSYYRGLLRLGVEIYEYTKGFIHSKTIVVDQNISVVGTANMDIRSFDLNFEVNAIVYDEAIGKELHDLFYKDLKHAEKITPAKWKKRGIPRRLLEKTARLLSPLM